MSFCMLNIVPHSQAEVLPSQDFGSSCKECGGPPHTPPPTSILSQFMKRKNPPLSQKTLNISFLGHVNRFSGHPYGGIFFLLLCMSGCFLVCRVQIRKTRCARIRSDPFESTKARGEIKGQNCFTEIKHVWVGHCLHGN